MTDTARDPQDWELSMTLVDLRITETAATVRVDGTLTAADTTTLHRAVQLVLNAEVPTVRLDLADVERLEPAALIVLVGLAQKLRDSGRVLSFVAVSDDCRDALTRYPLFTEKLRGAATPGARRARGELERRSRSAWTAPVVRHESEALA
jgi:anti-anti-sigma regulatory factor